MTWRITDVKVPTPPAVVGDPFTMFVDVAWNAGDLPRHVHFQWGLSGQYSGIFGDGVTTPLSNTANADGTMTVSAMITTSQAGTYLCTADIVDDQFGLITAGPRIGPFAVDGGWTLSDLAVAQTSVNAAYANAEITGTASSSSVKVQALISIDWGKGDGPGFFDRLGNVYGSGPGSQQLVMDGQYAGPFPQTYDIVVHLAHDWVQPDPAFPNDDAYPLTLTMEAPVSDHPVITGSIDNLLISSGTDPGLHAHVTNGTGLQSVYISVIAPDNSIAYDGEYPGLGGVGSFDWNSSDVGLGPGFVIPGDYSFWVTANGPVWQTVAKPGVFTVPEPPGPVAATGAAATDTTARGGYKHRPNATLTDASQVAFHVGGAIAVQAVGAPPAIDEWPTVPAPPPGLTLADAIPLSGADGSRTFDNNGASDRPPTIWAGDHAVWFVWTAPQDGTVSFTTSQTPPPRWDSLIVGYHGPTPDDGSYIGYGDDEDLQPGVVTPDGYGTSLLSFPVTAGQQFVIAVDTYDYNADSDGNPSSGYPRNDCVLAWSMA